MATIQFTFEVPDEISSNKDWFEYLSNSFEDLAEAYKDAAENSPDELPETHPFYTSMLQQMTTATGSD